MAKGKREHASRPASLRPAQRRRAAERRLRERLAVAEQDNRRLADDVVSIQGQGADFLALYSTLAALHGARDRRQVLAAVREIVVNVVGSERMALFELGPDGRTLAARDACGLRAAALRPIRLGSGPIGRAVAAGSVHVAEPAMRAARGEGALTACVPLRLGERVVGALAVFELFDHKPGLTALDRELFALLERHVAPALHRATLDAPAARTE